MKGKCCDCLEKGEMFRLTVVHENITQEETWGWKAIEWNHVMSQNRRAGMPKVCVREEASSIILEGLCRTGCGKYG